MNGHWKPSRVSSLEPVENVPGYDRLKPSNISRRSTGNGIDKRLYTTGAEDPHAVTPFLADNMRKDYRRNVQGRSYLILQGGDALYHSPDYVAKELAFNADRVPRPKPHNRYAGMREHNNSVEDGVTFWARGRENVRGQQPGRSYFGHDQVLNGHR